MIITLVGYMGCGKSTIGKVLAEKINYKFIDLDHYIETVERKSIKEIFSEYGEIKFRTIERKYLEKLLQNKKNHVVSLGGGTPIFHENMDFINMHSYSIYLYLKPEDLTNRLISQLDKRPLISHISTYSDLLEFIKKHLFERNPFYMKARLIYKVEKKTIENISLDLQKQIKKIIE